MDGFAIVIYESIVLDIIVRHVYYFGSTKLLLQLRHQFYLDRDNYLLVYFYHGIIKNLLFAADSEFFHRDYCGSSARALS